MKPCIWPLPFFAACATVAPPVQPGPRAGENTPAAVGEDAAKGADGAPTALTYPDTPRDNIVETLHGEAIADPYRWLEDVNDAKVQGWMKEEDKLTRAYLAKLPVRTALEKRLTELNYYDAVSAPIRRQGRYFYTRRHADREKAILYWRDGLEGEERVLIDPNTLSADGSISLGGYWPSYDGRRLAYKLKKNNADAATMYVMDVDTRAISDIDVIDGAKYAGASWTPDGKGFYYTKLPVDPSIPVPELPGHAHVRYHALGQSPEQDALVYPATGSPRTFVNGEVSRDGRYLWITVSHGWNATDVYVKDLRAKRGKDGFWPLVAGVPAIFQVAVWNGSFYVYTNHEAPRYRVFKVDPARPAMKHWREIVPEDEAVLENMSIVGGHLALVYMRNAVNELEVRTLDGKKLRSVALPGLGSVSSVIGNEDEDEGFYSYTSFTEPMQIYRTSIKTGESALWAKIDLPLDTSQMVAEQVWYRSKDGTRVSMFIIRKKDARPGDNHPVWLYGYGGFNVNMTPGFSTRIVTWVERGGVYALPNLRGGGEFGEDWHKAGMLLSKQNVFDDFIAAAEYLIATGWTTPERLAIAGGSNGGLLVGATMTQRPDLFKAVVCAVPLLDMLRYHLFGSGKTWIPEYGSAEDAEQFRAIRAYSPYHQVKQGTRYPALLMLAADSDDRVDPMHARKFVAAVQWAQAGNAPILLRVEKNAGHGGADLVRQTVEQDADRIAFLMDQLGLK